jgi:hypothetical protein
MLSLADAVARLQLGCFVHQRVVIGAAWTTNE